MEVEFSLPTVIVLIPVLLEANSNRVERSTPLAFDAQAIASVFTPGHVMEYLVGMATGVRSDVTQQLATIARRRLLNQQITRAGLRRPAEVIGWMGAVQA